MKIMLISAVIWSIVAIVEEFVIFMIGNKAPNEFEKIGPKELDEISKLIPVKMIGNRVGAVGGNDIGRVYTYDYSVCGSTYKVKVKNTTGLLADTIKINIDKGLVGLASTSDDIKWVRAKNLKATIVVMASVGFVAGLAIFILSILL